MATPERIKEIVDGTAELDQPRQRSSAEEEESGGLLLPSSVIETFPWRSHNNIALIDGTASVGGTCTGVHSTRAAASAFDASTGAPISVTCAECGNDDLHKAGKPFRTDRPFTDEEDDVLLVHLYKILMGGDKVEAVEQLAHEMERGAFEVICRIQFLTNSSTKIAEGLDMEDAPPSASA